MFPKRYTFSLFLPVNLTTFQILLERILSSVVVQFMLQAQPGHSQNKYFPNMTFVVPIPFHLEVKNKNKFHYLNQNKRK